jgi:formate--tetrahydrofolate ligase
MSSPDETQEPFPTDYEIAQSTSMEPIWELVEPWGLGLDDLQYFGEYTAKIKQPAIKRLREQARNRPRNLVLVTGMTPTPKGEGKTVTTVGLGQTLNHLGEEAMTAIREPSLGPVFGVKGGAAGGGRSKTTITKFTAIGRPTMPIISTTARG